MTLRKFSIGVLAGLLLAGLPRPAGACSQCLCGSPTPPGYLLGDLTNHFSYGLEDRYLSKSNVLEDAPGDERQIEHRVSGFLVYRPTTRVALQAHLPYVFKRNTEAALGEPEATTRSNGLGDAQVLARIDARHYGNLLTRGGALAVISAFTAPTGSNDARDARGDRLDEHLQPGIGAWSGSAGIGADLRTPSGALSGSVLGRLNGTSGHGYHYGNAVLFNLGYARSLATDWQATLEINGRDAARDRIGGGEHDPNSGGTVVYAAPSVRWSGLGPVALDLQVQIPFAQSLNGDQTEKTTGRLAIIWAAP